MMFVLALWVSITVPEQEGPSSDVNTLVSQLGAEDIETRERAAATLLELGEISIAPLEKALRHVDPEVAAQAKSVLLAITINDCLSHEAVARLPRARERLLAGDHEFFAEVLLVLSGDSGASRHTLEFLSTAALRGARDDNARIQVCGIIADNHVPIAAPALLPHLSSSNPAVRQACLTVVHRLRLQEALPHATLLLEDPNDIVRAAAAAATGALGANDAAPRLLTLLEDPSPYVRERAIESLGRLGYEPGLQQVEALYKRHPVSVSRWMCHLGESSRARGVFAPPSMENSFWISGRIDAVHVGFVREANIAFLNALRSREVWHRMWRIIWDGPLPRSHRQAVAVLARRAKMTVTWPDDVEPIFSQRGGPRLDGSTLIEALLVLAPQNHVLMVEGSHISFYSEERAIRFWETWLSHKDGWRER